MGDRGNVVLEQETSRDPATGERTYGRIYLYTHWGGYDLPVTLSHALENAQSRWGDETYLGRIIFETMIENAHDKTTGFGIGLYPSDNEYNYLVVNSDKQTVTCEAQRYRAPVKGAVLGTVTFSEFLALTEEGLHAFHEPENES